MSQRFSEFCEELHDSVNCLTIRAETLQPSRQRARVPRDQRDGTLVLAGSGENPLPSGSDKLNPKSFLSVGKERQMVSAVFMPELPWVRARSDYTTLATITAYCCDWYGSRRGRSRGDRYTKHPLSRIFTCSYDIHDRVTHHTGRPAASMVLPRLRAHHSRYKKPMDASPFCLVTWNCAFTNVHLTTFHAYFTLLTLTAFYFLRYFFLADRIDLSPHEIQQNPLTRLLSRGSQGVSTYCVGYLSFGNIMTYTEGTL